MGVIKKKVIETRHDELFKWLIIVLTVLFILIVTVSTIALIKSNEEKRKKRIEKSNTKKEYLTEYPALNDEAEFIGISLGSNWMDVYSKLSITVTDSKISDELYEDFSKSTRIKEAQERYASGRDLGCYINEIRYLYVTVNIKNGNESTGFVDFTYFNLCNYVLNDFFKISSSVYAFKYAERNGVYKAWPCDEVTINKNTENEFVLVFIVEPEKVNNVYLATCPVDNGNATLNATLKPTCINLEIKGDETTPAIVEEGQVSSLELRKYKQQKINNKVLNYNFLLNQEKPVYIAKENLLEKGSEIKATYEPLDSGGAYLVNGLNILDATLYDSIEEVPKQFRDGAYLENMTEQYVSQLGHNREDYRYLCVSARFKRYDDEKETVIKPAHLDYFYNHLADYFWLYNVDADGEMWYMGYPDDFYIVNSSSGNIPTGGRDFVFLDDGEEVTVMFAYVIPPDTVYDLYLLNYLGPFSEGYEYNCLREDNTPYDGAISLGIKLLEEGGIK